MVFVFWVVVIDKDNIVLHSTQIRTAFSSWCVDEIRIRELSNKRRDLWPHAMLFCQRLVWISFEDKSLKERSVQIISIAFFDSELVVVYFGAELPVDLIVTVSGWLK